MCNALANRSKSIMYLAAPSGTGPGVRGYVRTQEWDAARRSVGPYMLVGTRCYMQGHEVICAQARGRAQDGARKRALHGLCQPLVLPFLNTRTF